jgi:hypothetical protein
MMDDDYTRRIPVRSLFILTGCLNDHDPRIESKPDAFQLSQHVVLLHSSTGMLRPERAGQQDAYVPTRPDVCIVGEQEWEEEPEESAIIVWSPLSHQRVPVLPSLLITTTFKQVGELQNVSKKETCNYSSELDECIFPQFQAFLLPS